MGFLDRLSRRLDELSEDLLPGDLRDAVEGARDLLARNQPAPAAAALESALVSKPDHATALYLLGVSRMRLGEPQRALEAFTRARNARAGFSEAAVGLGETKLALGDAAAAIPMFREAIAEGGGRDVLADAYRGLGHAYLATGATDKGLRELRKALVEDPDDLDAAVALAEALLAAGLDADEARAPLERLTAAEDAPARAVAALGRVALGAGRLEAAEKALTRALAQPGFADATALLALADTLAARGEVRGAHEQVLRALALAPRDAQITLRLARLHARTLNNEAALDAYLRAAGLSLLDAHDIDPPTPATAEGARPAREKSAARAAPSPTPGAAAAILDEALELAVLHDLRDRARQIAAKLLALRPSHALARAVTGDPSDLDSDPRPAAALLHARLDLDAGAPALAAHRALDILRRDPSCGPARRLLADAGERELGVVPTGDLVALATRFLGITRAREALADLSPDAARALEAYDRPLLVTVMGEFSSGKSTFVNAFLGAQVAPVGVTPTTATINVLTYGREPGARIVYRDDRVRELAGSEVSAALAAIDAEEAHRIRLVEVLYPLDALLRVNIVDTPGLNSILPEHEATAREFIAQADAVVWLFTAGQAGKASEREALEKIRGEGKRVLGVVNKIDQAGPAEVAPLLAHVERELGGMLEAVVPVSARAALAAREHADAEALAGSGWPTLAAALEERFFTQARALKRDALGKRLGALLGRARGRVADEVRDAQLRQTRCQIAATAARADAAIFARAVVAEERVALGERVAAAYRAAARDVLELVRPRRTPFGAHSATAPDRDYLLGFLERSLAAAIEPCHGRAVAELRRSAGDAVAAAGDVATARDIAARVDDAIDLLEARVFDRARAYLRGHLRGGRLDDFFARVLPKLELTEDTVYHALVRDAPDLEAELCGPLAEHGAAALRAVGARVGALAASAEVAALSAEQLLGALDALAGELSALLASAS